MHPDRPYDTHSLRYPGTAHKCTVCARGVPAAGSSYIHVRTTYAARARYARRARAVCWVKATWPRRHDHIPRSTIGSGPNLLTRRGVELGMEPHDVLDDAK
eukprot:SAG31_NODE_19_length_35031_cov_42.510707_12_plen_101_part_00